MPLHRPQKVQTEMDLEHEELFVFVEFVETISKKPSSELRRVARTNTTEESRVILE